MAYIPTRVVPNAQPGCSTMRITRQIHVGRIPVGGGAPVSVQSMTNTDTGDAEATLAQIRRLAAAGCDIVRVAVPNRAVLASFAAICRESPLPVIADIHFSADLAVAAIASGAAAVRVNPGNLGDVKELHKVAEAARAARTPVRVGVNSGSLEQDLLAAYGHPTAEALAESARRHCQRLESFGFRDVKVSIKASTVRTTVDANRLFAADTDYPLHLGITEAGTAANGVVKSAVGIGALLLDGIGDTIRVSLTAPPEEEVRAAIRILEATGLRAAAPDLVSCPTCARTAGDLIGLTQAVEAAIADIKAHGGHIGLQRIAIMGCVVNGPGEAREADLGIAGDAQGGVLFRKGQIVRRLSEPELLPALLAEIHARTVYPNRPGATRP
jgi:(E)-4-hydroxy-3-methylbut-2-enyl-diphosphate synthase